jgi:hypothetical protein
MPLVVASVAARQRERDHGERQELPHTLEDGKANPECRR